MDKICFMTPVIFQTEGSTTHIIEVWKKMPRKLNAEVHMLIIEGQNDKRISNLKNLNVVEMPTFIRKINLQFIKLILYQFYSIIYCLRLKNLKLVFSRYTTLNLADILISKLLNIPLIVEVNGIYKYEKSSTILNKIKIYINEYLGKILFRSSTQIIVVTDNLKKILNKEFKIPVNKISVVYNGVDTDIFHPIDKNKCRTELGIDLKAKVICFVGSLAIWQGVENLIDSAPIILKKVPNSCFLIVGGGVLEKNLKTRVKKIKAQNNFIFTGWISYEKIPFYINASDICVVLKKELPIGYSPLKLYEYLACGRSIIATNIKGLDVIKQHQAGILVDPENSDEVARSIVKLLNDDGLRKIMGLNGIKLVKKNFTWDKNVEKVSNICKNFL